MVGTKLAHYLIQEKIGEGGMGIVYKARDTRLRRIIAIKILPQHLTHHKKALQRFIREAQTASALNHPNICTIYDIGHTDGVYYIAMEFIAGETLREILNRKGGLSEPEVIEIGLQICDALQAAHSKGVIHRDIKPENIMISQERLVKVMDFGLAKLKNTELEIISEFDSYSSNTDNRSSLSGLMGTVSYMSPEQIEKKTVDERNDIFSLGIVLYELIVGQPPFRGSDNTAVLESILNDTPLPLSAFSKPRAKQWDQIILKVLAKVPESRYATITEFHRQLKKLQLARAKRRERMNRIASVSFVLALILVGFLSIFIFPKKKGVPLPPSAKFYPIGRTFEAEDYPSFSPDGNIISYTSTKSGIPLTYPKLFFKDLRSGKIKLLPQYTHSGVDWSPDGTKIVFSQGTPEIIIADTSGTNKITIHSLAWRPKWSPNGRFIVFSNDFITNIGNDKVIFLCYLADSSVRQISPDNGLKFADPEWSPDNHWVICVAGEGSLYELWLIEWETGAAFPISDFKTWITNPVWCPSGKFIYFLSNKNGPIAIWRVSVDIRNGKINGEPRQVPVGLNIKNFDISCDGVKLIFARSENKEKLWQIQFSEAQSNSLSKAKLILSNLEDIQNLEASPDGTHMIIETHIGGIRMLFLRSLIDSTEQVVYRAQPAFAPSWSADGRWIAFDAGGGNNADIWRIPASGGPAEKIIDNPGADWMPTYSPDGQYLCFLSNRTGQFDLWIQNLATGEISQITNSSEAKSRGFWSHDSKKLAYIQTPKSIWIYDFSLQKAKQVFYSPDWQSGDFIVNKLAWSNDDSALYYLSTIIIREDGSPAIALIELSLGDKRQQTILRSQSDMQLSCMTFEIFKGVIYFVSQESNTDLWLAEGLQ